jgi:hypothetical protein
MKIKIDQADQLFSQYVRLRDKHCMRCHSPVEFNEKGLPVSHQASHFFGRSSESVRFEPDNVDCLCWGCHQIWGSNDREAYRDFKLKQLGEKRFNSLKVQANNYKKKDRKLEVIKWRLALPEYVKIAEERIKNLPIKLL